MTIHSTHIKKSHEHVHTTPAPNTHAYTHITHTNTLWEENKIRSKTLEGNESKFLVNMAWQFIADKRTRDRKGIWNKCKESGLRGSEKK